MKHGTQQFPFRYMTTLVALFGYDSVYCIWSCFIIISLSTFIVDGQSFLFELHVCKINAISFSNSRASYLLVILKR